MHQPTTESYSELDRAYRHFNAALFGGKLPPCVITLHRKKGAYGYFWGDTWHARDGEGVSDEIALNPETFRDRRTEEVLSTLVHEMCHLQQHHFGKPSRNAYHNKEWAKMMEMVGLTPTSTGQPGGKKTGQKVTHMIERDGAFERVCAELMGQGFSIPWQAMTRDEGLAKKKAASKTKYSCDECGANAWAKPATNLICGDCEAKMVPEEIED